MSGYVALDFETYSFINLPRHGLYRYTEDKSFKVLVGAAAWREDGYVEQRDFDFVEDHHHAKHKLAETIGDKTIVAHNAAFEERVLTSLGLDYPASRFVDSAVVARAAGASGHLEGAAPQLLDTDKMAAGWGLIKLFSMPGRFQQENDTPWFDSAIVEAHPAEWDLFKEYCGLDAWLSLHLAERYVSKLTRAEHEYFGVTMRMNHIGWPVDVEAVEEMQRRYLENKEAAVAEFRVRHNCPDLNLNSLKQMKEWCRARGVRASSFDEKHVASLLVRVLAKIEDDSLTAGKRQNYREVAELLRTKQTVGGSSLSKLATILNNVVEDSWHPGTYRLKDQYLHCGASQTLRTTGRSVQMQNLKQLHEPADMDELDDVASEWDNDRLAQNIRQVFTASERYGRLIVADFKSVENIALAWLSGETKKVAAFTAGKDLYKVMAASPEMFGVPYDQVTDEQRKSGKLGELSCGYGAGAGAVVTFAEKMGIAIGEAEAARLVLSWRNANPQIVRFWDRLDAMLHTAVSRRNIRTSEALGLPGGLVLKMAQTDTPKSLLKQNEKARSVVLWIQHGRGGEVVMRRYFHGCYERGRNVCYYRASDRKTGDLWRPGYTDPRTKQWRFYELYGGKLAGILTQSFCRELFFHCLVNVDTMCRSNVGQMAVVGQFHDEVVVDWKPGMTTLQRARDMIENEMSDPGFARGFPLKADVKAAYRYIK